MEFHIKCSDQDVAKYVLCSGSNDRAKQIADRFDKCRLVSDSRGYQVYSGTVQDIMMTVIGTGMGGPTMAIGLEELWHMGADTFIRVGSCGVLQPEQGPGDIIISSGAYRLGGTANRYLPVEFPAVPDFMVLKNLVEAANSLQIPYQVGIGISSDAFYAPLDREFVRRMVNAGVVAIEMDNDTLFILGTFRGWRTGAILASDGAPGDVKPEWGEADFRRGEGQAIDIAIQAMANIARMDES